MRITLTVEIESRAVLAELLQAGRDISLIDCQVLDWRYGPTPAPVMPEYTTDDYRNAPSGIGPLAAEWRDKPHRLVYDLCRALEFSMPTA